MANKIFRISPANSLVFAPVVTQDPSYNTLPLELADSECYFQKFETADITYLQCLSDWVPDFHIYNKYGIPILHITPVVVPTAIIGQTFLCYQVTLDFSSLPAGKYYAQFNYTDDSSVVQKWQSRPFQTAAKWPKTLKFEYKNFENRDGMIWNTGIVPIIRVEGSMIFTPAFNASVFTDQEYNATKLNGVPYQTFKLYLGNNPGIPDWFGNTFNYIFQCDNIKIDGTNYQNVEGSKWEVDRPVPKTGGAPTLACYSIEIMPVDNLRARLKTGDITLDGYTPFVKVVKFDNIGSNRSITVARYDLLTDIIVSNRAGIAFTLKVSRVTMGNNELGQFAIPADSKTIDLRELFDAGPYVLYLSGMTGVAGLNITLSIIYMSLAATPVSSPSSTPTSSQKGTVFLYREINTGDFDNDFDIVTGLGKSTGNYPTAALCDGRDGRPQMGGKLPIGWLNGDTDFGTAGDTVGQNHINITDPAQLPEHSFTYQRPRMDTVGTQYQGNAAKGGGSVGLWTGDNVQTNSLGSSADIDFIPDSIVFYYAIYLS